MKTLINSLSIQTSRGGQFNRCHSKTKVLCMLLMAITVAAFISCKGSASSSDSPKRYTVTFDTDGGSPVASQKVKENNKATKPAEDPTKENCVFTGWYLSKTSVIPYDFETQQITSDLTLYAHWEAAQGYCNITFVTNCDLSIAAQTIAQGQKATAPQPAPERDKYKFAGWYSDSQFTTAFDFNSPIEESTTVYARWIALFTVTFSGADIPQQIIQEGNKVTKPEDPVSSKGLLFGGWYSDKDFKYQFDFNTVIVEDKTLYAKWSDSWTVTFSGANDVPAQSVKNNAKATRPSNPANQNNLTFDDWYADATCTTKFDFNTPITSNTTIYAKWLTTFTVSFESNGGSAVSSVSVLQGGKVTKPADPTRGGRTFDGWYTDRECTKAFNFATMTVTRDFTLYAKWATPQGVENPLSIQIVKAELDVEYKETSQVYGKTVDFTSKCGEGDWYVDGAKVATGDTFSRDAYFYTQASRFCTVEFHKIINGVEYTWQALLSL